MDSMIFGSSLQGKNALVVCPEFNWGKDIAAGLKKAGAKVYLAGKNEAAMAAMVEELGLTGYAVYDHRTTEQTLDMTQKAVDALGGIDILVENSLQTSACGWDQTYAEILAQLEVTHLGMMLTVQTVGNEMARQGKGGSVILTTDTGALAGYDPENYRNAPGQFDADFSLVKGFIYGGAVNYARQAAGFLGENGARCNCLACAPYGGEAGFNEAYLDHSHLKTPVTGEDIAAAAVFLAGPASVHITGVILPVDGGYTAK